jgi:adenine-specific DNA methylase
MAKYTCECCLKEFSQKSHYDKHLKKKIPCQDNKSKIEKVVENMIIDKNLISNKLKLKEIIMTTEKQSKIKTMRYLGNKTDLLDFIGNLVSKYKDKYQLKSTIIDGFGGTGSVTQYFNKLNFNVISNDINNYAYKLCYSRNNITKEDLKFDGLNLNISEILRKLNKCNKEGFVYKNYSPNSKNERKYFTTENAKIIDGIRTKIEKWFSKKKISEKEYIHLISILIETVPLFSNIAGTYGAFLKEWDSRSLKTLQLTEDIHNNLLCNSVNENKTYNDDIRNIIGSIDADILYLDPPYNERDYASYYHVLETISEYNNPELNDNKTGTKKNPTKSNWCKKSTAKKELEYIIENSKSKIVLLSYNNEGIISQDEIKTIFEKYGTYSNEKKEYRRFKSNKNNSDVKVYEYIHVLEKNAHFTKYGKITKQCCLTGMNNIPDKSVNLICCDLPYGLTECKWDTPIDLDMLWECYNRILKDYGTIILFGQQPFTSKLVSSNYKMFKYSLVWKKSKPGGFAQAPYKVLCEHEDILIFTYGKTTKNSSNRMTYNPQGTKACEKKMKGKTGSTEHRKGRKTQNDYVQTTTNYPRSILEFNNEGKVLHSTQKPLGLIEYLVKTFSNETDTVLDNCMGSGTTAISCIKNNRKYLGFEKDDKYFDICIKRIDETISSL